MVRSLGPVAGKVGAGGVAQFGGAVFGVSEGALVEVGVQGCVVTGGVGGGFVVVEDGVVEEATGSVVELVPTDVTVVDDSGKVVEVDASDVDVVGSVVVGELDVVDGNVVEVVVVDVDVDVSGIVVVVDVVASVVVVSATVVVVPVCPHGPTVPLYVSS